MAVEFQVEVPAPGADALAQSAQAHGFAGDEVRRKGDLHGHEVVAEAAADAEADASAGHKVAGGQGEHLFFVDLLAQPALDGSGKALAQAEAGFLVAPGDGDFLCLFLVDAFAAFVRRRFSGVGGRNLGIGGILRVFLRMGLFPLLPVQFAIDVLEDAAGKGVVEQVPQDVLLGVAVLLGVLSGLGVGGVRFLFVVRGLFLSGLFLRGLLGLLFLPSGAGLLLGAAFLDLFANEALAFLAGAAAFGGVAGLLFGAAFFDLFANEAFTFFAGAAALGGIAGALLGAAAFLAAFLRLAAAFFGFLARLLGFLAGFLGGLQHGREGHIGFVEQLKVVAGVGIAGIEIGVQLEGPFAVGAFELLQTGVLVEPEYLVALLEGELSAAFHESWAAVVLMIRALASQRGSWASRSFSRR